MNVGAGRLATGADRGGEADHLGMGLQLVRASNLTMTRLHLALQSGDRRLAMMAVDGLMDIDAEMEGFVADLVGKPDNDEHWQALTGYLAHQKAAIATEKHALTGMVGRAEPVPPPAAMLEEFPVGPPPVSEIPEEAQEEAPRPGLKWGPTGLVFLLIFVALALVAAGVVFAFR